MMNKVRFVLLFLLVFVSAVRAGSLPAPLLQKGRYVYTVPTKNFAPPGFSSSKLDELNRVLATLHYPFYVVLVERLPGPSDRDADAAVDGLPEDWSLQEGYDLPHASVFLLSFAPRKYRLLAGPEWKNRFGLEREQLTQFHQHFKQAMSGTPKDPFTGIVNTARALDSYLWEQLDPVQIAARAEATKKRVHDRQLEEARAQLSSQIKALNSLLEEKNYLPPDSESFARVVAQAQNVLLTRDLDALKQWKNMLYDVTQKLSIEIDRRRQEARTRFNILTLKLLFGTGFFGLFLFVYLRRRRQYLEYRQLFEIEVERWDQMVRNALNQYTSVYQDRDDVVGLKDLQGKTKTLYDEVTAEVNDIYLSIRGLEAHVQSCKALGARASFFRVVPLKQATARFGGDFVFDTEQVNRDNLFGSETKTIRVNAEVFAKEQAERFKTCQAKWQKLKDALALRFDSTYLNSLLSDRDKLVADLALQEIPKRWMEDHPLLQPAAFTSGMKDLIRTDPVEALEQLAGIWEKHHLIRKRCDLLIEAVVADRKVKNEVPPKVGGDIVLDAADSPEEAKKLVALQEQEALRVIETAELKNVAAVEAEIKRLTLYRLDVTRKVVEAASAMRASKKMECLRVREKAQEVIQQAEKKYEQALGVHAPNTLERAKGLLESARKQFGRGTSICDEVSSLVTERRYLNANRRGQEALDMFEKAKEEAVRSMSECQTLDDKKMQFEQRQKEMESRRRDYEHRIRGYGNQTTIVYNQPIVQQNGMNNYLALLALQEAEEARWRKEEAAARRAHEERLAEEARERQHRAYSSSHSSYSSSSSSSSSSSWDSGSSSSSGSSWGGGSSSSGGDFGGGGGSSSSGGDW